MNWHEMPIENVSRSLKVDIKNGLNNLEVRKRALKYGKNVILCEKKSTFLKKLFIHLSDFMVISLLVASAISFTISFLNGSNDYVDSLIILFVVVLNIVIGILQENKAEKDVNSLKSLSSLYSKVIRNGKKQKIKSEQLVPGDIIILKTGDLISADARILESSALFVEESSITGESLSIPKDTKVISKSNLSIQDMKNMVFSGTIVTRGHGKAIVTDTAMNTQVGKIAKLINKDENFKTPLSIRLEKTGKILGIFIIIICIIVFVLGIRQSSDFMEIFMISISLAVAAIPEGLPAVVTIVLASGVRKMVSRNTIVRNLCAVETLGHTTVICSDKTGTLTLNKMKLIKILSAQKEEKRESLISRKAIKLGSLCNNSVVIDGAAKGEPTENAILEALLNLKINKQALQSEYERIYEVPFTSLRKLMTTVHKTQNRIYKIITKGAPDIVIKKCKYFEYENKVFPMTSEITRKIERFNKELTENAMRVIAIAYKDCENFEKDDSNLEDNLVFLALLGIEDPIRPEAKLAVSECKKAGIKPVIITGDHPNTAKAIGKSIGILDEKCKIITGSELNKMSIEDLKKNINKYCVFARVSPEHKVKIVKAFQKNNEIVAMTGDGVNDAPALKAADIGCAMGKSGTDAAKSASDMIIADDNFATIVEAIKHGRAMFENIKKTIHFLISTNIGEMMVVLFAFILKISTPLLAIHLLWINMVTDAFPALALGVDPIDEEIMKKPPTKTNESIMPKSMIYNILVEGTFIAAIGFLAYVIGRTFFDKDPFNPIIARTMTFATLGLSQIVHAFNVRSKKSILKTGIFENMKLFYSFIFCVVLQIIAVAIPSFNSFFKTVSLNFFQWIIVFVFSLGPLIVSEIEKYFYNKSEKHKF